MKKVLLLFFILFQTAFAQSFNFELNGEHAPNEVLKKYIQDKYEIEDIDVCAFNYENYIIGIAKTNLLYSLEGYKLIVLKKEDNQYIPVKCDIFFDNKNEINIQDNKIIYYKSVFYKNKKYTAYIKKNEIKTYKTLNDKLKDKKVKNIEQITVHTKNEKVNNLELTDFKTNSQKKVNIQYKNLNEKTKRYLEMK